ncbi:hypothetical protein PSACC_03067 [Paramicrosporidium saccamoebae]|uniref:Uncharacterized protein n=1 Tax=Paramicrosporidium saccamoebae TaxID=1246581 RepID=A0A2H9TH72_9FUNG|nr:hypothetical protein PSACC_03067 [Paramicrosporidium saccamoebae]
MWWWIGVAIDAASIFIAGQQGWELWKATQIYGKGLVNLGMISGLLFMLFVRMMIFHAFQGKLHVGDSVNNGDKQGIIEQMHLFFSQVRLSDGSSAAVWNLETLVQHPEGKKDQRLFDLQTWSFPGTALMALLDGICCMVAIIPPLIMTAVDYGLFTVYWSAAVKAAVFVTLTLGAQISLLKRWLGGSLRFADTNVLVYEGLFWSVLKEHDGYIAIKPNIVGQVCITPECRVGPYL